MDDRRKILLGTAACGVVCAFLPWVNAPIVGSLPGTHGGWGMVSILGFLIVVAAAMRGDRTAPLGPGARTAAGTGAVLAGAVAGAKWMQVQDAVDGMSTSQIGAAMASAMGAGIGLYLTLLGAFVVLAAVIFQKMKLA